MQRFKTQIRRHVVKQLVLKQERKQTGPPSGPLRQGREEAQEERNDAGLVENYRETIQSDQETSALDEEAVQNLGEAVGKRYLLVVNLPPPQTQKKTVRMIQLLAVRGPIRRKALSHLERFEAQLRVI